VTQTYGKKRQNVPSAQVNREQQRRVDWRSAVNSGELIEPLQNT
jgi:hypothetical protein